ncbi:hypothetical protein GCM10010272_44110 [Streptomyces lateritius]|nr:hypothetical protein GCM10010272_44110 [Streptomyces lateritius]
MRVRGRRVGDVAAGAGLSGDGKGVLLAEGQGGRALGHRGAPTRGCERQAGGGCRASGDEALGWLGVRVLQVLQVPRVLRVLRCRTGPGHAGVLSAPGRWETLEGEPVPPGNTGLTEG